MDVTCYLLLVGLWTRASLCQSAARSARAPTRHPTLVLHTVNEPGKTVRIDPRAMEALFAAQWRRDENRLPLTILDRSVA